MSLLLNYQEIRIDKIKLKSVGYRLVYEVIDNELVVVVVAIGKRENNKIYEIAAFRNI